MSKMTEILNAVENIEPIAEKNGLSHEKSCFIVNDSP